jgi:hypothetical protein
MTIHENHPTVERLGRLLPAILAAPEMTALGLGWGGAWPWTSGAQLRTDTLPPLSRAKGDE